MAAAIAPSDQRTLMYGGKILTRRLPPKSMVRRGTMLMAMVSGSTKASLAFNRIVFLDLNNNGQLDPGEQSTVTASDGSYSFTGLRPGAYSVAEVMQSGWGQSVPGGVTSTNLIVNGNFESGSLSGWTQQNTGSGSFVVNNGTVDPPGTDGALPSYDGFYSVLSTQSSSGTNILTRP